MSAPPKAEASLLHLSHNRGACIIRASGRSSCNGTTATTSGLLDSAHLPQLLDYVAHQPGVWLRRRQVADLAQRIPHHLDRHWFPRIKRHALGDKILPPRKPPRRGGDDLAVLVAVLAAQP